MTGETISPNIYFTEEILPACKKKNSMKKHVRTKHNHCISCDECGKLVASQYSLDINKEKDHTDMEKESDQSFVFSESMLDKFLSSARKGFI